MNRLAASLSCSRNNLECWRRTASKALFANATTWNGSHTIVACFACWATALAYAALMSMLTAANLAQRAGPSSAKNSPAVAASRPGLVQITLPLA